ncbi:TIGR02186 family protein [Desulfohalobiaceae bacterium Ax17]|uniref:TIGR02186 family protein n=1 Tax=Desulfovulcanus ferrireducens TaxID=2831190 RepID=UPI00207BC4E6|nr:TIGR02186 family protein [Desulfovulcanus ferrireducens]MBT8763427.1 TIGR02186 family protein [Desulfovulcanus ferrireducens]
MKDIKIIKYILLFMFVTIFLSQSSVFAFHFSPEVIKVGVTYKGAKLYVSGEVEDDRDVVVQVVGSGEIAHFKQKGKVGGILWMTVGHVTFENAPSVYFTYLPEKISKWADENNQSWKSLGLGFDALFHKIEILPASKDKKLLFDNFLKLKSQDNLYQLVKKGVSYKALQEGKKKFMASINIPAKMPLGTYELRVIKVKGEHIQSIEKEHFKLEEVGFPLFLSKLAFEHSLLYGIMAVVVAIFAGLFMGVLFKDRGGAH